LPANVPIAWDQFKAAFRGNYIPPGLMAIKHTEFMRLSQGNKSLTEYLQSFNNLARYATEFVDSNAKKIASFKRGLSPKLMKTMGTSKCTTFNDFISDALTQENNNAIYSASKSHKRALEASASQSRTPAASRASPRPPAPNAKFRPPQKKSTAKTGFRKAYTVALPKGILVRAAPVSLPATCLAGTTTSQAIGPGTVLILRRMSIKVVVKDMLIITVLRKFHLVRLSLLVSS
jgi:hypothetical protein